MFDIEVVNGVRHAVIYQDSLSHRFLKAVRSRMMMKRLGSEDGQLESLTFNEMLDIGRDLFKRKSPKEDLELLELVGIINSSLDMDAWAGTAYRFKYDFTELGRSTLSKLQNGDDEVLLSFPTNSHHRSPYRHLGA